MDWCIEWQRQKPRLTCQVFRVCMKISEISLTMFLYYQKKIETQNRPHKMIHNPRKNEKLIP